MISCISVDKRDDSCAGVKQFDVGPVWERKIVVINTFGGLEVFSLLVQMSFSSSDARREMFREGELVYARPSDEVAVFYGFGPRGDGGAATASM